MTDVPLPVHMADSIEPGMIPPRFRRNPNGVLIYVDGPHAWGTREIDRFPNHWGITVTGNPAMAPHAREIDVERYDATPENVPGYADSRAQIGKHTDVYCARDTVPLVIAADNKWESLFWHIATLDNYPWTPPEIVKWLEDNCQVKLDQAKIRAIQNVPGATYDTSEVFGTPNWAHPAR
jgi:hypothetical protein